jgi:hypothetical protein
MARGWESKSVEEQQAEVGEFSGKPKPRLTTGQRANQQMREGLLMSRNHIVQRLTAVQNSRHHQMLESALADLDAKISQLG